MVGGPRLPLRAERFWHAAPRCERPRPPLFAFAARVAMKRDSMDVPHASRPARAPLPLDPAGRRAGLVVVLLALAAGLAGVFTIPPLDRDESRYAQATAQMLESGDFVRIRFQDAPRHKKPAGIHWLQAASVAVLSSEEARAIWAYRIPSLLGAGLAALAAWLAGLRLVDPRAAFIGAASFGVCVLLGVEAGIAKTDAALAGFTTLAFAGLAWLRAGAGGRRAALLFWAAFAAAVLVKGPVAPLFVVSALAVLALWERRIGWARPLLWWPGPLLAAAIALPWFVAIELATGFEFLRQAVGEDLTPKIASGVESHGAPPGYHTAFLVLQLWPATLFLVPGLAAAAGALRAPRDDAAWAGMRFLLAWAIPAFLVYELTPTKLSHYTLPAYPALALIAGAGALAVWRGAAPLWSRAASYGLFALGGLAGAALLAAMALIDRVAARTGSAALAEAAVPFQPLDGAAAALTLAGAALVAGLTLAALVVPRLSARIALALTAALAWHWTARAVAVPQAEPLFTAGEFVGVFKPAERPVGTYAFTEPSLVFRLGGGVAIQPRERVFAGAASGALPAVIVPRADLPALRAALAERARCAQIIGEASGLNYSNGDALDLVAVRVACEEGAGS